MLIIYLMQYFQTWQCCTFFNATSFGIFLLELLFGDFLEGGELYHGSILLAWVNIEHGIKVCIETVTRVTDVVTISIHTCVHTKEDTITDKQRQPHTGIHSYTIKCQCLFIYKLRTFNCYFYFVPKRSGSTCSA